ncbi:hypothetical protein BB8028_0001g08760 [Beauveria bassiana]|uniref:Uncharacterized protein n=1 Tax=Beauveria bassiana TaxID=176275 RepID=A0A2S7XYC6_BEABA|nr:hypothetical protein BB8028_0001g08760 [Beauveria bassiana]
MLLRKLAHYWTLSRNPAILIDDIMCNNDQTFILSLGNLTLPTRHSPQKPLFLHARETRDWWRHAFGRQCSGLELSELGYAEAKSFVYQSTVQV